MGDATPGAITARRLRPKEVGALIDPLCAILIDCVDGGASVGFMAPLSFERAQAFWRATMDRVATGAAELLVAQVGDEVVGTVQLGLGLPENQPHRADIAKMLVRRAARGRGVGAALMIAAERLALQLGKTLLVLDTASDAALRLYLRQGWTPIGRAPGYALWPGGGLCDTTFMYKQLAP